MCRTPAKVILCVWLGFVSLTTFAQDFTIFNRAVQVHGFATQGFIYTNHNEWLTMHTSQGSGAFTDFGVNMSTFVTDKLHVGGQLYDRNLGTWASGIHHWTGRSWTTRSISGLDCAAEK